MSKKLSDLFVVYQPQNKTTYDKKEDDKNVVIYNPDHNWNSFLKNLERIQSSQIGTLSTEPILIQIDYPELPLDWNSYQQDLLWGFLPEIQPEPYFGMMSVSDTETGRQLSLIPDGPLTAMNVVRARNEAPENYSKYISAINEYRKNNPDVLEPEDWDMLEGIAGLESTYDLNTVSSAGALGWFLIMPSNITNFGYDIEEFKKDPMLLIEAAIKLYKYNKSLLYKYRDYLQKSGLTPFLATYMYWWGPNATLLYLTRGYSNISDTDKNNIQSIIEKAR